MCFDISFLCDLNNYKYILCFNKIDPCLRNWVTANSWTYGEETREEANLKPENILIIKGNLRISIGLDVGWCATFAHQLRGSLRRLCRHQPVLTFRWRRSRRCTRSRISPWWSHSHVQMTKTQCDVILIVISCAIEQECQRPWDPRRFTEEVKALIKRSPRNIS